MAFINIYNELLGTVAGLNIALAKTKTNEALSLIYDEQLWSFQLVESGWLTPGLLGGLGYGASATRISPGTITAQAYTTTVTGDAVASAAWLGLVGRPLLTEMQIRSPYYSLYNIVAMDATVPTAVVLTLDRPWMEPIQTAIPYMIYQAYVAAPAGFKKFMTMRDTTNNAPMDYWSLSQMDLAVRDPERTMFDQPSNVVPYQADTRPGSATPGQMLYELWPHPLSILPYSYACVVKGPILVNASDAVPYPLNDEVVKWRALEVCFLWKEAQRGDNLERGSGADWRFLSQEAHAQYLMRLGTIKRLDQNMVDLYWTKLRRGYSWMGEPYATINGQLNIGSF